jgi:hypothetical protein
MSSVFLQPLCNASIASGKGGLMVNISSRTSLVLGIASLILAPLGLFSGQLSLFGIVAALSAIFALTSGFNGLDSVAEDDVLNRRLAKIGIVSAGLGLLIFIIAMGLSVINYYQFFR